MDRETLRKELTPFKCAPQKLRGIFSEANQHGKVVHVVGSLLDETGEETLFGVYLPDDPGRVTWASVNRAASRCVDDAFDLGIFDGEEGAVDD